MADEAAPSPQVLSLCFSSFADNLCLSFWQSLKQMRLAQGYHLVTGSKLGRLTTEAYSNLGMSCNIKFTRYSPCLMHISHIAWWKSGNNRMQAVTKHRCLKTQCWSLVLKSEIAKSLIDSQCITHHQYSDRLFHGIECRGWYFVLLFAVATDIALS